MQNYLKRTFPFFVCLSALAFCLLSYLEKQNELTELRLVIPKMEKEIKIIQEENQELIYQIQAFESPDHLIEMAMQPEFSHLKHPFQKEVLVLKEDTHVQSLFGEESAGMLLGATK